MHGSEYLPATASDRKRLTDFVHDCGNKLIDSRALYIEQRRVGAAGRAV